MPARAPLSRNSCRPPRSYFGDVIDKEFHFGVHLCGLAPISPPVELLHRATPQWTRFWTAPMGTPEIADSALTLAGRRSVPRGNAGFDSCTTTRKTPSCAFAMSRLDSGSSGNPGRSVTLPIRPTDSELSLFPCSLQVKQRHMPLQLRSYCGCW